MNTALKRLNQRLPYAYCCFVVDPSCVTRASRPCLRLNRREDLPFATVSSRRIARTGETPVSPVEHLTGHEHLCLSVAAAYFIPSRCFHAASCSSQGFPPAAPALWYRF